MIPVHIEGQGHFRVNYDTHFNLRTIMAGAHETCEILGVPGGSHMHNQDGVSSSVS